APEQLVGAYLRGLFDADGTVEKRDGVITLSSVSELLIRQAQIVLLNFGVVAAKSVKRTHYRGRPHRSHLLTIAGAEADLFHELIGFALERKCARRQVRRGNTNVDVVPHLGTMLNAAVREAIFTRAEHKIFADYRRQSRRPSYDKLAEMVCVLTAHGVQNEPLLRMRELLDHHLL